MYAAEQTRFSTHERADYSPNPQKKVRRETVKKTVVHRSYHRETVVLLLCVLAFLALNLFLLQRFAEITSSKHQVTQMANRLEQMQNQREQLMVEIEKSSKLEWIEQEALTSLGMRYPDKSQIIYISVDPAKVEYVASQINYQPQDEPGGEGLLPQSIEKIFHKFAGVLRI